MLAVGQSLGEPVTAAEGEEAPAGPAGGRIRPDHRAAAARPGRAARRRPDANLYLTLNRPDYEPVPVPFEPIVPDLPGETGHLPVSRVLRRGRTVSEFMMTSSFVGPDVGS